MRGFCLLFCRIKFQHACGLWCGLGGSTAEGINWDRFSWEEGDEDVICMRGSASMDGIVLLQTSEIVIEI